MLEALLYADARRAEGMGRIGTSGVEFEERLREAAAAIAPNMIALAYFEDPQPSAVEIVESLSGGVQRRSLPCGDVEVELLVVDKDLFESDVRDSALLEVVAGRFLLSYSALEGGSRLREGERAYKRRKIRECLASLVHERPELSRELLIEPRYFVHESLLRLSHVLPQAYDLLRALDDEGGPMEGYEEALRDLEREGVIHSRGGLVSIDAGFVDSVLRRGIHIPEQLIRAQRLLRGLIRLGLSGAVGLLQPRPLSTFESLLSTALGAPDLPQPERFLHFPTAAGLTRLTESTTMEDMIAGLEPSRVVEDVQLRRFGSFLNEVYLLSYAVGGESRRGVVKRYPNWFSLKWGPIALWTLGTQNFAILGRSRMERECASSVLLARGGVPVPRILKTNFEDRLLIREYLEGLNLAEVVRGAIKSGAPSGADLEHIGRAGSTLAAVHGLGATLGDCKPENFILDRGRPVVVDLEQGVKGGNEAWDLAEFLYFSGHYADPLDPLRGAVEVARAFIRGYIGGGGAPESVAEAGRLRYAKVFAPIILPQVLYVLAKTIKREVR